MTTMVFCYDEREWILSDEASASSYGSPVLIADDGRQLAASEIAIPAGFDPEFGTVFDETTAYDIVCQGEHNHGQDISREHWRSFAPMLEKFASQWAMRVERTQLTAAAAGPSMIALRPRKSNDRR